MRRLGQYVGFVAVAPGLLLAMAGFMLVLPGLLFLQLCTRQKHAPSRATPEEEVAAFHECSRIFGILHIDATRRVLRRCYDTYVLKPQRVTELQARAMAMATKEQIPS